MLLIAGWIYFWFVRQEIVGVMMSLFSITKRDWFPMQIAFSLRIGLTIVAFFALLLFPMNKPDSTPDYPIQHDSVVKDALMNQWSNWDGLWYLKIADQGYQANPCAVAFFPL